jgi:hypothetical protein
MDLRESTAPSRDSTPSRDHNPRKRARTACTRCKTRKQKVSLHILSEVSIIVVDTTNQLLTAIQCDNEYPVCSNCQKAGTACDKASVRQESGQQNV